MWIRDSIYTIWIDSSQNAVIEMLHLCVHELFYVVVFFLTSSIIITFPYTSNMKQKGIGLTKKLEFSKSHGKYISGSKMWKSASWQLFDVLCVNKPLQARKSTGYAFCVQFFFGLFWKAYNRLKTVLWASIR